MPDESPVIRRRFDLRGQVQGVGFRPHVYRLATGHGLAGHVANNSNGALIEVEGAAQTLEAFEQALVGQLPPLARISEMERRDIEPLGETGFRIRASDADAGRRPEVTPDAATCQDCLRELLDPADRRHRYPFTNCTNCGPRYSIIRGVPYDRPQTTMAVFPMCPACDTEYRDPANRRFHAQPNACPVCGPQVQLLRVVGADGDREAAAPNSQDEPATDGCTCSLTPARLQTQPVDGDAIREAARLLHSGKIVAVKGIGGYHLACRADQEDVVRRLRLRKLRDGKPLAVMVPDLATARRLCRLRPADEEALSSTAAPIVLAPVADRDALAPSVAPGCPDFGLMLPYTPIHHLLFAEGLGPLVMTSANLAGRPLTYRDDEALAELSDVADAFLTHNREIFRPIDDSVVVTFRDEAVPIRRARGYAPRPIRVRTPERAAGSDGWGDGGPRILAVGGELKSTVCLLSNDEAILSEHLGDLTHPETYRHFARAIDRLKVLCGFEPDVVACDMHPRYLATDYARRLGLPVIAVQHHHAHIASIMAEWGETGPVVGLSCDGTGFGTDHAVWGCELLLCERGDFRRLGHLKYFPLVGGDAAALETWRPAAALLRAVLGRSWVEVVEGTKPRRHKGMEARRHGGLVRPSADDLLAFEQQAAGGINAPPTSSLGRVFDGVSFLLGLCGRNRHEAEAAMALEAAAADQPAVVEPLAYEVAEEDAGVRLSLLPTIADVVRAREAGEPAGRTAARFHESVARMLADAAGLACRREGLSEVALSGGCFANRRLFARTVELLETDNRQVLYHRQVPCGDGGLGLGQALVAAWQLADGRVDFVLDADRGALYPSE